MTVRAHLQPLLIASAPNGAYKTREDHSALPITAAQLAETAADVLRGGARMLHLHVRDARGQHTLDAAAYRVAIEAIRARTGEDLFIQVTSESAGVYTAEQQRQAMYALSVDDHGNGMSVDGMSIALREAIRTPADVNDAQKLFHHLHRQRVLIQYILYSNDDIARYNSLRAQEIIPPDQHSVLLVVGRYGEQPSTPDLLHQMIDALDASIHWMVCAFGQHEFDCLVEAVQLGGHVRIGFENSLRLKSGQVANSNHQLITQLVESGNPNKRPLADIHQARKILGAWGGVNNSSTGNLRQQAQQKLTIQ